MIKGFFKPKNKNKYLGNVKNITYRSSYELKAFMKLDHDPEVVAWSSEEIVVPYISPLDNRYHRYFTDLYFELNTGEKYLIEIKPKSQTVPPGSKGKSKRRFFTEAATYSKNLAKWNAAESYATKRGWIFKIWTEDELGIPRY